MPAKNSRKQYLGNGYYHLYNRGVEKRNVFQDDQDYAVFLSYLKTYLLPKDLDELQRKVIDPNVSYKDKAKSLRELRLNNFSDEISLIAYCLMPNHFHLLVKQKSPNSIDVFMNSLCTRYTMYFNRKYQRVGPLYQGVYKAVLVEKDDYLLHLTRYIHQQAGVENNKSLQPSSYEDYLGTRKTRWISPETVLSFFSKTNPDLSYTAFVVASKEFIGVTKLLLDD